jgi:hypothetical protein
MGVDPAFSKSLPEGATRGRTGKSVGGELGLLRPDHRLLVHEDPFVLSVNRSARFGFSFPFVVEAAFAR